MADPDSYIAALPNEMSVPETVPTRACPLLLILPATTTLFKLLSKALVSTDDDEDANTTAVPKLIPVPEIVPTTAVP